MTWNFAQSTQAIVQSFSTDDGLSHDAVNNVFHAQDGYIWIATNYGLNRYDGNHFKAYTKEKHGLSSNQTSILGEDDSGHLWLNGTYSEKVKDFCIFDPKAEKAITLQEKFKGQPLPFEVDSIVNIYNYEPQKLWIVTRNACYSYENKSFKFRFQNQKNWEWKELSTSYDLEQKAWWINVKHPIQKQDKVILTQEKILLNLEGKIIQTLSIDQLAYEIHILDTKDQQNTYFFVESASTREVFRQSANGVTQHTSFPKRQPFVQNNKLLFFYPKEILIYNFDEQLLDRVPVDLDDFKSARSETPIFDRDGGIWVTGFATSGLDLIHLYTPSFKTYLTDSSAGIQMRGILEVNHDTILLGTTNSNTGVLLKEKNKINPFLSNHRSFGIYLEDNKHLWWGADGPRVYKTDLISKKIELFRVDELEDAASIFWSFYKDKQGQLWTGSLNGIWSIDTTNKKLSPFEAYNEFSQLKTTEVFHFHPNKDGVWIATSSGLYLWEMEKGVTARYHSQGTDDNYLPHDFIAHLHEDKEGIFWLATKGGGLIQWNPVTKESKQFQNAEGLSHNVLYAVYEDEYDYLWMSSDRGINRFHKKTFLNTIYTTKNGISHNEFNTISHYQTSNGQIYFGGQNGMTSFHPKDFINNKNAAPIPFLITSFLKWNTQNEAYENLTSELLEQKTLYIHPNDKELVLNFALLDYKDAQNHQYRYKIVGYDNKWVYLDVPELRLNKLDYGNFDLILEGKTANAQWAKAQKLSLKICVTRPFYNQWWFIISNILLVAAIIFLLLRLRIQGLKKRQLQLESEVNKRTEQIKKDKEVIESQAEELKALDQLKSRFFANITHELRTPLTLILGPLSSILENSNKLEVATRIRLEMMKRNGNSLLQLINEILDLSKLEAQKLELNEKVTILDTFIKRIFFAFESQAKHLKVEYKLNTSIDETLQIYLDQEKFEKIINNLLSNALKFTAQGERVEMLVFSQDKKIQIQVKDTGKGIHPEDIKHVFDRFYQTKQTNQSVQGGTGIGLALAKELSELMGGNLSVDSILGEGSIFHLNIPIKRVNDQNKLIEQVTEQIISESIIPTKHSTNDGKKYKILLAEDNTDMRHFIQSLLTDYEVIATENGLIAWEYLQNPKNEVDLVLSDIMMPQMDGFELIKHIKSAEHLANIPLLILTARTSEQDQLQALTMGVDSYLSKPFSQNVLLAHLKNILANYQKRQQWQAQIQEETTNTEKPKISEVDQKWIKEVEEVVIKNLDNEKFTLEYLAQTLSISYRQLGRKLKKIVGLPPSKYLREIRLNMAYNYLQKGTYMTVSEVGFAVGFIKIEYFSDLFLERFGQRPNEVLVSKNA